MRTSIGTLFLSFALASLLGAQAPDPGTAQPQAPPANLPAQPEAQPPAPPAEIPAPPPPQADQGDQADQPGQPAPPQAVAPARGQWVYTQEYGWVWMPFGSNCTYAPPDGSCPCMYVYYPVSGWCWVTAPWLWGCGPVPYFGPGGPGFYFWWGRGLGRWGGFRGAYRNWGWSGRAYWGGSRWVGLGAGAYRGTGFRGGGSFQAGAAYGRGGGYRGSAAVESRGGGVFHGWGGFQGAGRFPGGAAGRAGGRIWMDGGGGRR